MIFWKTSKDSAHSTVIIGLRFITAKGHKGSSAKGKETRWSLGVLGTAWGKCPFRSCTDVPFILQQRVMTKQINSCLSESSSNPGSQEFFTGGRSPRHHLPGRHGNFRPPERKINYIACTKNLDLVSPSLIKELRKPLSKSGYQRATLPACLSRRAVSGLLCSLSLHNLSSSCFLWEIAFLVLAGKSFHQAPSLKVASFLPALLLILVTWLVSSGDKSEDFRDGDSEPSSLPLVITGTTAINLGSIRLGLPSGSILPPGHPSVCPICPLAFLLQIHLCFPQGTKKKKTQQEA